MFNECLPQVGHLPYMSRLVHSFDRVFIECKLFAAFMGAETNTAWSVSRSLDSRRGRAIGKHTRAGGFDWDGWEMFPGGSQEWTGWDVESRGQRCGAPGP